MSLPKLMGIYQIHNLLNGKIYIGSTNNFSRRWNEHRTELRGNRHHNQYLQNSWNVYGEQSFVYEILEIVYDINKLSKIEQNYVDNLNPDYNISECIDAPFLGLHLPEKSKKKLSKMRAGKNNPFYGMKHSEETKRKMSKYHQENPRTLSDKQVQRIIENNLGEKSHYAKLNWNKVRQIRKLKIEMGYTNDVLGRMFDVTPSTISYIILNKTWIEKREIK